MLITCLHGKAYLQPQVKKEFKKNIFPAIKKNLEATFIALLKPSLNDKN